MPAYINQHISEKINAYKQAFGMVWAEVNQQRNVMSEEAHNTIDLYLSAFEEECAALERKLSLPQHPCSNDNKAPDIKMLAMVTLRKFISNVNDMVKSEELLNNSDIESLNNITRAAVAPRKQLSGITTTRSVA